MRAEQLRRLDRQIFLFERTVVCFSALVMVSTVTLDICHRALLGAESHVTLALLSIFGILTVPEGSSWSPWGFIFTVGAALALGRAAISSWDDQRGEQGSPLRWIIGAPLTVWTSTLILLHCPSWTVCLGLSALCALTISRAALARGRQVLASLTLIAGALLCYGSTLLPRDYVWSQEIALLLLAYVAFLGGSMATYEGQHLRVEALQRVLPKPWRPTSSALGLIVTGLFSAALFTLVHRYLFGPGGSYYTQETRPATGLPAWLILFSAYLAFATITVRSICYGVSALRTARGDDEETVADEGSAS